MVHGSEVYHIAIGSRGTPEAERRPSRTSSSPALGRWVVQLQELWPLRCTHWAVRSVALAASAPSRAHWTLRIVYARRASIFVWRAPMSLTVAPNVTSH